MAAHLPSLLRSVLDQWEFSDRELLRDEHERMNGVGVVADYEKLESDYVLYLIAKALGPVATPFSPPREVDSLWHAHLLNSAEYRRLETIVVTATGSGRKFLDHSTRTAGDHHGRARRLDNLKSFLLNNGVAESDLPEELRGGSWRRVLEENSSSAGAGGGQERLRTSSNGDSSSEGAGGGHQWVREAVTGWGRRRSGMTKIC